MSLQEGPINWTGVVLASTRDICKKEWIGFEIAVDKKNVSFELEIEKCWIIKKLKLLQSA